MMSCTGRCGIGQYAKQPLADRAAAGPVSYKSRSGVQSPASECSDRRDAWLARLSSGDAPGSGQLLGQSFASVFDKRLAARRCGIARALRRRHREYPAPDASAVPSQRSFPQASVQRLSAGAESQVGMCTPLVTYPTGTSSSGQCGKRG